ncbi:hypothetical protein ACM66B_001828 [Microbotryomycetes sp. NB124-2]
MPPPSTVFAGRSASGFDPATLSDDDDFSDATSLATAATGSYTTLGYADGLIDLTSEDAHDWTTSRIGGVPCFPPLSFVPPSESSLCQVCSTSMPLVTQIYCPLETSSLERVLYVFACVRKTCQGRTGSVRAWRASQMWSKAQVGSGTKPTTSQTDESVSESVKATSARPVDLGSLVFGASAASVSPATAASSGSADSAAAVDSRSVNVINPFAPPSTTMSSATSLSTPFNPFAVPSSATASSRGNPFAAPLPPPQTSTTMTAQASSSPSSAPSRRQRAKYLVWPESAKSKYLFESQYVATMYEPDQVKGDEDERLERGFDKMKLDDREQDVDNYDDEEAGGRVRKEGKGSGGRVKKGADRASASSGSKRVNAGGGAGEWSQEGYEVQKIKGVDQVFLKFQARVLREPSQVLRYHHSGEPLAFSSTLEPFKTLFKSTSSSSSSSSGDDNVGRFTSSLVPRCPTCSSDRVFELELMPNLINKLGRPRVQNPNEQGEERDDVGFGWSTVWVCTCAVECTQRTKDEREDGEAWREEKVYIEVEQ